MITTLEGFWGFGVLGFLVGGAGSTGMMGMKDKAYEWLWPYKYDTQEDFTLSDGG